MYVFYVHVCVHVQNPEGNPTQSLYLTPLRHGLSLNLELTILIKLAVQQVLAILLSQLLIALGLQTSVTVLGFFFLETLHSLTT